MAKGMLLGAAFVLIILHPWGGPRISIDPAQVEFPPALIGSSSEVQRITLENTGYSGLHISNPELRGTDAADFAFTNNCVNNSVERGKSCWFDVHVTPGARGERVAFLMLPNDSQDTPKEVLLVGSGSVIETADLRADPTTLDFDQPGNGPASRDVTLSSVGIPPADISTVTIEDGSAFRGTRDCEGKSLAQGQTCRVNVAFQPVSDATSTGFLVIRYGGQDKTLKVPLRGLPLQPPGPAPPTAGGQVEVEPQKVVFQGLSGRVPDDIPLTVKNAGDGPLQLFSTTITQGGETFLLHGNCSNVPLPPHGECAIRLSLAAQGALEAAGSLVVSTDDRTVEVPLSAHIAEAPRPRASISPPYLVLVWGGPEGAREKLITVINTGNSPLDIQDYRSTLPQEFVVNPNGIQRPCLRGMQLAPKDWCQLRAYLRPGKDTPKSAGFELYDNAVGSPQGVPLYARIIARQLGSLVVGDSSLDFGRVPVAVLGYRKTAGLAEKAPAASAGSSKSIRLTNGGPGSLTILSVSPPADSDFQLDASGCAGQTFVQQNDGCQITIAFTPHSTGPHSTSVTITHNGTGDSRTITFQGEGVYPYPSVKRRAIYELKRTRPQAQPADQPPIQ
jgi:hypothetical protein